MVVVIALRFHLYICSSSTSSMSRSMRFGHKIQLVTPRLPSRPASPPNSSRYGPGSSSSMRLYASTGLAECAPRGVRVPLPSAARILGPVKEAVQRQPRARRQGRRRHPVRAGSDWITDGGVKTQSLYGAVWCQGLNVDTELLCFHRSVDRLGGHVNDRGEFAIGVTASPRRYSKSCSATRSPGNATSGDTPVIPHSQYKISMTGLSH